MGRSIVSGVRIAATLAILAAVTAAAIVFLALSPRVSAHSFFDGVVVSIVRSETVEGRSDAVALSLHVMNGTASAATLRGLSSPSAERLVIERRREVFGVVLWQPVDFLRLEPGEAILLEPPKYRVTAETRAPKDLLGPGATVIADFGPLGAFVAWDIR